ncbi:hypothetical protein C7377_1425 [Balneicella halophila]|uniref:Uncharacterized protein n=1 Tax=Balneicella halophila TaxID=1537566 RepID=A0A7L4UR60_BALHA|nr:hypothetical protein [Balneicella halophila]PVX51092.1 hypothetical protein C7377_1425 [Balneicella halophila]
MKKIVFLGLFIIIIFSCMREEKPKVIYPDNENIASAELEKDTSLIELADIPIHFDSTKYLIHPIGEYKMYGSSKRKSSFGAASYGSRNLSSSNYSKYEITGNLLNLRFQHLDSDKLSILTTANIRIKSITFLRGLFKNTKKQFLIYRVLDKDTNQDNVIDNSDVESLYLSHIDGYGFEKLSPNYQELIDWRELEINNRVYFRSVEDTNKNGEFDRDDNIHYHYVEFTDEKPQVVEYNPI